MFLVAGASGHVGRELVAQLADLDRPVRALVRRPVAARLPPEVELATGDLNQPETVSAALTGVTGMFLLGGFADMTGLLARIRSAGVRHVVLLSSRSVIGGDPTNAVVNMHLTAEKAVRESGVSWTVLRPSGFMSNTFEWLPQLRAGNVVRAAFPTVPIAMVDPYDIAAVAATVLAHGDHHQCALSLSGPHALLPAERLWILGKVLGRQLRLDPLSDAQARADMEPTMPAAYVDAFFRFFSDGEFNDTEIVPTIEQVTGRAPRTYEEWAIAHIDEFH